MTDLLKNTLAEAELTLNLPGDREVYDIFRDQEMPDTEGLGYENLPGGRTIGYVEHVNGKEAAACKYVFQATNHELKILVKYWYRELMNMELLWFSNQTTGSTEWLTAKYAARRFGRIRSVLDELADEPISEVDAEVRKRIGETQWERFQLLREAEDSAPWNSPWR
jgi:hypothetical protein